MGLAFRGRQCLACPHANSRAKRSMCRYSIEVQINSCHTKWCHAEMFKIVHFQQKTAFYSQKNSPLDALVRMRSPVRIWVAAPTFKHSNSTVWVLFFCFLQLFRNILLFAENGTIGKTHTKTHTTHKFCRTGSIPARLFLLPPGRFERPDGGSHHRRGCTFSA